jgi:transporter family-2 protein
VALFTVGLVAGTTLGGLAVDVIGLGPGGHEPITAPRLAGAGLGLLAIVASASHGLHAANPALLVAVVVAGSFVSFQQAVNGRVRECTDATVATLQNFVVVLAALLVGLGLRALLVGVHAEHWPGLGHWWLYLGGPIGASFVAVAAVIVKRLGVLRLGLAVTAGQLAGGILLDIGHGLVLSTVLGALLAMAAVVVSGARPRGVPVPA